MRFPIVLLLGCAVALSPPARAQLVLDRASTERLANGLTLIVLEEHSLPSVSVQMLYRVGGRDESYGATGVAHFLEHMAFRATANFPDTEVVSRIYAAGGEWHGYTWIDQTTYFATVPKDRLELLLRIEADRMARLELDPAAVEPERGAVLAELHGYENDPASVLHDAVVFTALQAHPYRNNVIGWESDVRALRHGDLLAFYRRHYVPANAVLAVAGDVDAVAVVDRVREYFGGISAAPATPAPRTVEPRQNGERRIELLGDGPPRLEIAWQAPGVNDPDFPAFLVLREWLGGGSGLNFMQDSGTTPVRADALLAGLAPDAKTWFPPSAGTYLFSVTATLPEGVQPEALEARVAEAVSIVRQAQPGAQELAALQDRVAAELVFDVETHEDAAHQLAFFEGLGATRLLQELPGRIAAVDAAAIQATAQRWLQPRQRTVGWYRPADAEHGAAAAGPRPGIVADARPAEAEVRSDSGMPPVPSPGIDPPAVFRLESGLPVIVQRSGLSPGVHVRVVLDPAYAGSGVSVLADEPVWAAASLAARSRPADLAETFRDLRTGVDRLEPAAADEPPADDPETRLEQSYRQLLGITTPPEPGEAAVRLIAVAGAVDAAQIRDLVAREFAGVAHGEAAEPKPFALSPEDLRIRLRNARAQAWIGYAVPAPLPAAAEFEAWRALLYVLTHGYEGRLGTEAISRRGLAYYIDGQYRSDGRRAWIAVSAGVDPDKMNALEALYRSELERLAARPPDETEVAEARAHFLGRLDTARQSNEELTAGLAEAWLWWGRIPDRAERRAAIEGISREAVLRAIPAFIAGRIATVAVGKSSADVTD